MSSDQGERGERGDQGVRGDIGPRGEQGGQGAEGNAGSVGAAGQDALMSPNAIRHLLTTLRRLVWSVALVSAIALGYTVYQSYEGRVDLVNEQREYCEGSTVSRIAVARALTAHSDYLQDVTAAASVMEDVKRAARESGMVFRDASAVLRETAAVSCADSFPEPSLLP